MSKALYLGIEARSVYLDGPALRIVAEGRADVSIPLRQVSRVVANATVEWTTSALLGCLGSGISVALLQPDGQPIGLCLPARSRAPDLEQRLRYLEQDPGGRAAFDNWALSEERRAILALLGREARNGAMDLRPQPVRARVLLAADGNIARAGAILIALEGLLASQLSALLLGHGLGPRRSAPAAIGRLDLFGACLAAARWELASALGLACEHRRRHANAWRSSRDRHLRLARRYEAIAPKVVASQARRMRRLEVWLWDRQE